MRRQQTQSTMIVLFGIMGAAAGLLFGFNLLYIAVIGVVAASIAAIVIGRGSV